MTLEDLLRNVQLECTVKIECYEDEDNPTIYYEDYMIGGFPGELEELHDREVAYMFPYTFYHGKALIAGICIELAAEDYEEI